MNTLIVTGKYQIKLDSLGRIIVPRDFREQIALICRNSLYLRSMNDYIVALPPQLVERILPPYQSLEVLDDELREERRRLSQELVMVTMDVQGRVRLPELLLARFTPEGQVIVLGTGEDFEVWPAEYYIQRYGEGGGEHGVD